MEDCIFCKIINREIPAAIVYEDDFVVSFPDIHPKKPVHLLIIPKKHIPEITAVVDNEVFSQIGQAVKNLIKENSLEDKGYKVMINGGGHQDVNHLHVHLLGPMGKPHE